jgi:hypothetical protein
MMELGDQAHERLRTNAEYGPARYCTQIQRFSDRRRVGFGVAGGDAQIDIRLEDI